MGELSKINRKIKAAMKRYVDSDDPDALGNVLSLARKREEYLLSLTRSDKEKV